ncbi:MAG TPA: TetR/AcrR family transcriptional regulator [Acidimicrobiales bacterium]|nr:TetR/AcrR family transcriptional regulator [Acidimicrobiales bacterium]
MPPTTANSADTGEAVATDDDLRSRLIAATAQIIASDGPLAVRVDEVARLAGCSRATVYRYVADKDELVRTVLVGRSSAIAAALEDRVDEDGDPADWIVEGLLRHAEAVRAEPWFQALQRQGAAAAVARVGGGPEALVALAEPLVAPFLARIDARGALRHDITLAEATEWLIGVHLGLLNPVFPHRGRHQTADMLRKFVAYALLAPSST